MVGVICLNQTNRKQVKRVLPMLLGICPTPVHLINTAPDTNQNDYTTSGHVKCSREASSPNVKRLLDMGRK